MNKAIIMGNLGQDVELKSVGDTQVANFSVATNERWVGKDGKPQERTEWHSIVVWGKQAENCAKFLSKGSKVLVEGNIQTRTWDDAGSKRYRTEIRAQNVQFISTDRGGGSGGNKGGGGTEFSDDDIPF